MTDVSKIQKELEDRRVREITESTNSIFDNLVGDPIKAKIPEAVFKEHFLEYFQGKPQTNPERNVMAEWIGVAGSPMAEVDVLDKTGALLFTVPPVLDTSLINVTAHSDAESFGNILNQYTLINNNTPIAANHFLTNNLIKKSHEISHAPETTVNSRWVDILARYGVQAEDSLDIKKADDVDDDLVYD